MIQDGVILNGVVYEAKPCKVKQPRDWSDRCEGCAFSDPHKNFCHANTICFSFERLGGRPYQMYILQRIKQWK